MCSYNRMKLEMFNNHLLEMYSPCDIIDKLDISIGDLLTELDGYIMDNLQKFSDDLEQLGICTEVDADESC